ncbi:MAG: 4Fe-4S dicluster domain-containing protein [Anaerolineae bacterium]
MAKRKGLVANLDRCMGCFACEVACKQEHALPEGVRWIRVETLGPYEVDGELAMDFVPLATEGCDFCRERVAAGRRPSCVETCPTQALGLYEEEQVLRLLRTGPRVQICRMGVLENG